MGPQSKIQNPKSAIRARRRGTILRGSIRYLLIRPESIAGIYGAVAAMVGPERAGEAVARGVHAGFSASLRTYMESRGVGGRRLAAFVCRTGTGLGWGAWSLVRFDGGRLDISVSCSPFAGMGETSCHPVRGVLAALGEAVLGGKVRVAEMCSAGKGGACRFTVTRVPEQ